VLAGDVAADGARDGDRIIARPGRQVARKAAGRLDRGRVHDRATLQALEVAESGCHARDAAAVGPADDPGSTVVRTGQRVVAGAAVHTAAGGTLFPYTTLFRSVLAGDVAADGARDGDGVVAGATVQVARKAAGRLDR